MAEGERERGGILELLDLIEERHDPLQYDFNTKLHRSLSAIPDEMGWREARALIRGLVSTPGTATHAAIAGWDYPVTRSDLIAMDLYDVTRWAAGDSKWKGYPRPFESDNRKREHFGNAGGRSPAEVTEFLRKLGHNLPPVPA